MDQLFSNYGCDWDSSLVFRTEIWCFISLLSWFFCLFVLVGVGLEGIGSCTFVPLTFSFPETQ